MGSTPGPLATLCNLSNHMVLWSLGYHLAVSMWMHSRYLFPITVVVLGSEKADRARSI